MQIILPDGLWPTMLTPFTVDDSIDYSALEELIEWYIANGADGLFAMCQSSEMWRLFLRERVAVTRFVVEKTAGRLPVIASGHISEAMPDQLKELEQIADTGIQALILVTNRLAGPTDNEEVMKKNVDFLLSRLPNLPFGLYECPHPYKRLVSPEFLRFCEDTGRFYFLKDTSCDVETMRARTNALTGQLKIFNANTATLHESLANGVSGFCGIMANFHPQLYRWYFDHVRQDAPQVTEVVEMLTTASLLERQFYPVNAKYHLRLEGQHIQLFSRTQDCAQFTPAQQREVEQVRALTNRFLLKIVKM